MTYANRGMALEQIIELANAQYERSGLAVITKIPTPVKVLNNKGGRITGFYEKKSTVDFYGIVDMGYKTVPIAFDCKQTKGKNLPFSNIPKHQLDYMEKVSRLGGKAFIIVNFSELDQYHRLDIKELLEYIENPYKSNKKSIPTKYFEEYATELKLGGKVMLDYLKGL